MMYSWSKPVWPLTKAIWPLVLGLNTGETSLRPVVSRRLPAPEASAKKISVPLWPRDEAKAILLPSDDQAGEILSPPKRGKATGRPRSVGYIMICQESLGRARQATGHRSRDAPGG